jgi:lipopolysaccharide biosynthesis regulator YciM
MCAIQEKIMNIEDLKSKFTLQEAEILIDFLDNNIRTRGKYKCQICGFDVCKKECKIERLCEVWVIER